MEDTNFLTTTSISRRLVGALHDDSPHKPRGSKPSKGAAPLSLVFLSFVSACSDLDRTVRGAPFPHPAPQGCWVSVPRDQAPGLISGGGRSPALGPSGQWARARGQRVLKLPATMCEVSILWSWQVIAYYSDNQACAQCGQCGSLRIDSTSWPGNRCRSSMSQASAPAGLKIVF